MNRGGKRKGAGRRKLPAEEKAKALTIKAHPLAVAKFKLACREMKLSHRELFEAMVGNGNPNLIQINPKLG
jgi:hypothetical protein